MLKKAPACVLASLNTCDVRKRVRLGISLAAALPDDLFEHPANYWDKPSTACAASIQLGIPDAGRFARRD